MATAKKTKSGAYSITVYDYTDADGKQHNKRFTANTKKEAELLAAQFKVGKKTCTNTQTVSQCLEEFIKLRTPVLSPSTIRGYKSILNNMKFEYPNFMSKSVKSIKEKDFQGLISEIALDKSPKTTKNICTLLRSISDSFRDFNIALPQIAQYEPYIPTDDEIKAILDDVKGKEMEVPIMLGAYCMMRRSEIVSLKFDNINFAKNTIHIRQATVLDSDYMWVEKAPKTKKSDRTIKVASFVLDAIKEKGYVTNLSPSEITERFKRIVVRLGMPKLRFHDLRHYACSVFAYQNVGIVYVQKYGGWSNSTTPQKIYSHCLRDKEDVVYDQLNSYFEKVYK